MKNSNNNWNKNYSRRILKCDLAYIKRLNSNYFGDTIVGKPAIEIDYEYYPRWEFSCGLCDDGNKKENRRPACWYPTHTGYLYCCLRCDVAGIPLYKFLLKRNPAIAKRYQQDRYIKKTAGYGFNCPEPPRKKLLREHYARIEREVKERNKRAYDERNMK